MSATQDTLYPLRSIDLRIDMGQRDRFVDQMKKFGRAYGFDVLIRTMSPDPNNVMFNFTRQDLDLVGSHRSDTGAPDLTFGISFYPKWTRPGPPAENVEVLVQGLKTFLRDIPGAIIVDRK
jgi:hypothetical protein